MTHTPAEGAADVPTIDQALARLRREWRGADSDRRAEIEDDAHYIKILQGVLS